jgi:predicted nucleotidyltransferase
MWKDYNKYKVLKVFFDDPLPKGRGFQLRALARKVNLAPKSVGIYLKQLEKEGLVLKEKYENSTYPLYRANRDNEIFRLYKKLDTVSSLFETGLVEHLQEKLMPDCIVLFGSASRGEDVKESDIDLFVQCKETKVELDRFEKALGRKIHIFFTERFSSLSKELKNNIANGTVLKGYLEAF